ncbi:hypothetical protein [Blastococcus sp. TF02A-35]|uniref:aspartate/ornithine carbamoyltransferase family protein n=1 Tax=Blastococcus sp. TF02A-35 TaxID=2559612 RepID=UPI00107438E9|nr:hypothetical protein [Blastococcus sp. TF02A_35]TFV52068.1 hypothetical protein E4P43_07425 [Blastococcus sp. TF02A_35]
MTMPLSATSPCSGLTRPFSFTHLTSVGQLEYGDIVGIFDRIDEVQQPSGHAAIQDCMAGKVLGVAFFQPSTRTRLGFETAAHRLGGRVVGFSDIASTRSVHYTGESIEDATQVLAAYSDIIVMRHFVAGAAARAAEVSTVPIINGGDGSNEHPTQAITDAWLMDRTLRGLSGRTVALIGDPGTRVLRSLAAILARLGVERLLFMTPDSVTDNSDNGGPRGARLPEDVETELARFPVRIEYCADVRDVLCEADALEMLPARIPSLEADPRTLRGNALATHEKYRVTREKIESTKSRTLVFHPGPRSDELHEDTDSMPNSMYWQQVRASVHCRMALMAGMVSGE